MSLLNKDNRHKNIVRALPVMAMALGALSLSGVAQSQSLQARYTIAESGQGFNRLSDAVNAIGNGTGTIIIAPGTINECAVQEKGNITYRAAVPGKVTFDKGICEGKAALVLRGNSARVEGIIFQNMAVRDGNGAGIRLERGDLYVTQSWFRNSEQGILSASDPNGKVVIDKSTFTHLGRCDRGLSCAHSLYFGDYGSLTVTRSRFEKGDGGHYVKSRAARFTGLNNSFDDTAGSKTNYMIDLPAGATGEIAGNVFVQGENKDNWSAFIAIAAEGRVNSSAGLSIHDNVAQLATGVSRETWFVANWSNDQLNIGANQLGNGLTVYQQR